MFIEDEVRPYAALLCYVVLYCASANGALLIVTLYACVWPLQVMVRNITPERAGGSRELSALLSVTDVYVANDLQVRAVCVCVCVCVSPRLHR